MVHLARRWSGIHREGIELLHAGLGVDVGGDPHGRNNFLGDRVCVAVDGGHCQCGREMLNFLVVEVDRGLGADGGGDIMDLVDDGGGNDLFQTFRRTGDGCHCGVCRGHSEDDFEDLLGHGGGAEDVGDGRRRGVRRG